MSERTHAARMANILHAANVFQGFFSSKQRSDGNDTNEEQKKLNLSPRRTYKFQSVAAAVPRTRDFMQTNQCSYEPDKKTFKPTKEKANAKKKRTKINLSDERQRPTYATRAMVEREKNAKKIENYGGKRLCVA